MIPRIGQLFVLSAAALLAVGCGQPGGDDGNPPPLSPEKAAQYRQVKVKVTGAS